MQGLIPPPAGFVLGEAIAPKPCASTNNLLGDRATNQQSRKHYPDNWLGDRATYK
jgi:hypothetical protein